MFFAVYNLPHLEAAHQIALVVLSTPQWPLVRLHMERIAAAVNSATAGSYTDVEIPFQVMPK